jgi:hypothetical protein
MMNKSAAFPKQAIARTDPGFDPNREPSYSLKTSLPLLSEVKPA